MSEMLRRVAMMMQKSSAPVYATWNPSDKGSNVTLTNGNKTATAGVGGATQGAVRATVGKTSGKWYWEVTLAGSDYWFIGAGNLTHNVANYPYTPYCVGVQSNGYYWDSTGYTESGVLFGAGNVVGIALDMGGLMSFYLNGVLQHHIGNFPAGGLYPIFGSSGGPSTATANFGASAFVYSPPAGYNAGVY